MTKPTIVGGNVDLALLTDFLLVSVASSAPKGTLVEELTL